MARDATVKVPYRCPACGKRATGAPGHAYCPQCGEFMVRIYYGAKKPSARKGGLFGGR